MLRDFLEEDFNDEFELGESSIDCAIRLIQKYKAHAELANKRYDEVRAELEQYKLYYAVISERLSDARLELNEATKLNALLLKQEEAKTMGELNRERGKIYINGEHVGFVSGDLKLVPEDDTCDCCECEPTVNEDELIGYIMRTVADEQEYCNLTYKDVRAILDAELDYLIEQGIASEKE